jgi:alpha-1,3-glucosyltransferase
MSEETASESKLRKRTTDTQPEKDSTIPEEEPELKVSRSWFKWDIERTEWDILFVSTAFKLLLYPA